MHGRDRQPRVGNRHRAMKTLANFAIGAEPPAAARAVAARAFLDTIGVTLAGAREPAAASVQRVIADEGSGGGAGVGPRPRPGPPRAGPPNGTPAAAPHFYGTCVRSPPHPRAAPLPPGPPAG